MQINYFKNKIMQTCGESMAETLIALLIVSFSSVVLITSVKSSNAINSIGIEDDENFNSSLESAYSRDEGNKSATGSVTIKSDDGTESESVNIDLYGTGDFVSFYGENSTTPISYESEDDGSVDTNTDENNYPSDIKKEDDYSNPKPFTFTADITGESKAALVNSPTIKQPVIYAGTIVWQSNDYSKYGEWGLDTRWNGGYIVVTKTITREFVGNYLLDNHQLLESYSFFDHYEYQKINRKTVKVYDYSYVDTNCILGCSFTIEHWLSEDEVRSEDTGVYRITESTSDTKAKELKDVVYHKDFVSNMKRADAASLTYKQGQIVYYKGEYYYALKSVAYNVDPETDSQNETTRSWLKLLVPDT